VPHTPTEICQNREAGRPEHSEGLRRRDDFFIGMRSDSPRPPFLLPEGREKMRAVFLGQNICSLGFGIATLQAPRLVMDEPVQEPLAPPNQPVQAGPADEKDTPPTTSVTNPPRLCA
jgi:hypothetical protein